MEDLLHLSRFQDTRVSLNGLIWSGMISGTYRDSFWVLTVTKQTGSSTRL
jgi:hypothetical protein